MSFAAKIILTVAVTLVVLAAGTVGLGVYLWSRHSGDLLDAGQKHFDLGQAFGEKTDESGCVAEAIIRYKANRGLTGSMATNIFLGACLGVSRSTAGFCDQVPKPFDFLKNRQWQDQQTKRAGIDDLFGRQVFALLQTHCASKVRVEPQPQ
ncbi:MAG: hypothetical protein ABIT71_25805 [Vicinamibacteraceae bacterium]